MSTAAKRAPNAQLLLAPLVALAVVGLALWSCAARQGVAPAPSDAGGAGDLAPGPASQRAPGSAEVAPAGRVLAVVERPGKPPLRLLFVDLELYNAAPTPRWFLVSSSLPEAAGGVDKLERLAVGTAVVGRFLGTGGAWVLRLEAKAKVTIRGLEVGWWSDGAMVSPPLQLRAAEDGTAGGTPLQTWLAGAAPLADGAVLDLASAKRFEGWRAPGDREVPLELAGGRRAVLAMPPAQMQRKFAPGPPVAPAGPLLAWLEREPVELRPRVRLPIVLARGEVGFSTRGARVGAEPDAPAVICDDTALGVPLSERARAACKGDAPSCALWLEGRWRGRLNGVGTFQVLSVGEPLAGDALKPGLRAEVEAQDR